MRNLAQCRVRALSLHAVSASYLQRLWPLVLIRLQRTIERKIAPTSHGLHQGRWTRRLQFSLSALSALNISTTTCGNTRHSIVYGVIWIIYNLDLSGLRQKYCRVAPDVARHNRVDGGHGCSEGTS